MTKNSPTRRDDLRSGTPLWINTPNSAVQASSELPTEHADVVVVGAGISGALVAESLTARGHSVLIVDRRPAARGSTAASTAMIQHEIDVPLSKLEKQIGKFPAQRAWRRSVRAVKELESLVIKAGIDCGWEGKETLFLAGDKMGCRAIRVEVDARKAAGIKAKLLDAQTLQERYRMKRSAAILSSASASANPAQLTAGLLRLAMSRKARLVSPMEITDVAELGDSVALATGTGRVIMANYAVFCTGYEHLKKMQSASHRVTSTWAIASEPQSDLPTWLEKTIVWEASDPYLYFRLDRAGRIIAGGEDEESDVANSKPRTLARKSKIIAKKFEQLTGIPIRGTAYRWSAPFSVTNDGLPIIDRVPSFERVYTVMGFGGNGITFSMIGAQIVASFVAGRSDPDFDLFSFR